MQTKTARYAGQGTNAKDMNGAFAGAMKSGTLGKGFGGEPAGKSFKTLKTIEKKPTKMLMEKEVKVKRSPRQIDTASNKAGRYA